MVASPRLTWREDTVDRVVALCGAVSRSAAVDLKRVLWLATVKGVPKQKVEEYNYVQLEADNIGSLRSNHHHVHY